MRIVERSVVGRMRFYKTNNENEWIAAMFFDEFVRPVYSFLSEYIRERQRDGAFIEIDPAVVIRAFIGMVMHHSLNNNLWDPKRRLLNISNESAARIFTDMLLHGITSPTAKAPLSMDPNPYAVTEPELLRTLRLS